MTSRLLFLPLADFAPGTLLRLLSESYASLVESDPEHWLGEQKPWSEYDAEAFGSPQTVGACVFITTDAGEPVGFASWDPRQSPEKGIIGHNCVVPDRQGQGIGTSQVREVLRRFRVSGIRRAAVTTGEHGFFLRARRMYLRCGFRETRRYAGGPDPRWRLIDYTLDLHRAQPGRQAGGRRRSYNSDSGLLPDGSAAGWHNTERYERLNTVADSALTTNAPANRLRGSLPKIGIRPAIDGRYGGVRESLESQVMGMARATAEFLTGNLKHACGLPVECVIADTCIGGVSEAARCAEKFAREGVGVSITVTPCWCYGSETMDMDPLVPKAVWGFNGTERPGAVYLAAVLAAHAQKGLPAFGIYGRDVQDIGDSSIPADVQEKLLKFARAGLAAATMRGASYLAMGAVSMGIAGSIVDNNLFESYLGMRVEQVDMSEFIRRIDEGIYDKAEFDRALAWVKANCKEGLDPNDPASQHSREKKDETWEFVVKMALIARDLMNGNPRLKEIGFTEESEGHNALAGGFQGQRHWTDHFPNGDFMEAILCSSFDWNGIRQPYVVATENDSLNGATMLLGHLLTGTAQMFSDVRTYWSPEAVKRVTGHVLSGTAENGIIHLINSGASALDWSGQQTVGGKPGIKRFTEISAAEAQACIDNTRWCPASLGYFRGGGFSSEFLTRGGMPCTMSRMNMVQGLGPVLQIAEGWTVDLPTEVGQTLANRTDPTWPTTWFVPRLTGSGPFRDVYSVMNNWGANHGAICFGHVGADLIALASILRIPVDMHNVGEEAIFRPSVWTRFGGLDPQGADYRACAAYGPLYR